MWQVSQKVHVQEWGTCLALSLSPPLFPVLVLDLGSGRVVVLVCQPQSFEVRQPVLCDYLSADLGIVEFRVLFEE